MTATNIDQINCDQTEEVRRSIQSKINNVCVTNAVIKQSEKVRTLDCLKNVVKINNDSVQVNPILLFTRLIALVEGGENMFFTN